MTESSLIQKLHKARSFTQKKEILWKEENCIQFFAKNASFLHFLKSLNDEKAYLLSSLITLDQGDNFFSSFELVPSYGKKIEELVHLLKEIDEFYASIGGIIGYHLGFLALLKETKTKNATIHLHKPFFLDCRARTPSIDSLIEIGLKNLTKTAFIFPIGGSSDRFNLQDKKTHQNLPLAFFNFAGMNLLEHLIYQTSAWESLYFQTFHKKITCPIVFMTSEAKNNRKKIIEFCKNNDYFHRDPESFFFCHQPSVPVISESGRWILDEPLTPSMKPGGHGALWKVLQDQKGFDFLLHAGCKYALIRQINNPIAGLDYGLITLLGYGVKHQKLFGFSTCNRQVKSASGMLVLKEVENFKKTSSKKKEYYYSNIEYSDFTKWGIEDKPLTPGGKDSEFPANTNVLFADLMAIQEETKKNPLPGIILNLKSKSTYTNSQGIKIEEKTGRIELCMQNIADGLISNEDFSSPNFPNKLKSFLIYQKNEKALSPIKHPYVPDSSFHETPEKCFYDLLSLYYDLLKKCQITLPDFLNEKDYIQKGPNFVIYLSPFLGPLFSQIEKKIFKGCFKEGFHLDLTIQDLNLFNLNLEGTLCIHAKNPTKAKCVLENVNVINKGTLWKNSSSFIQKELKSKEALKIDLNEGSEFVAHDASFKANNHFIVPANKRMVVKMQDDKLVSKLESLEER